MGFWKSTKTCYAKMVVWKGRASRSEYWWFFLFQLLLSFALNLVAIACLYVVLLGNPEWFNYVVQSLEGKPAAPPTTMLAVPAQWWIWSAGLMVANLFLFFLPSLAVFVRRLHDSGHSGWWYWIALVPIIGIIVLFVFLLLPSDEGHNRFGPPPGGERPFMPIGYDTKALRKAQKAARKGDATAMMQQPTREDEFREYYRKKVEPAIKRPKPGMG